MKSAIKKKKKILHTRLQCFQNVDYLFYNINYINSIYCAYCKKIFNRLYKFYVKKKNNNDL